MIVVNLSNLRDDAAYPPGRLQNTCPGERGREGGREGGRGRESERERETERSRESERGRSREREREREGGREREREAHVPKKHSRPFLPASFRGNENCNGRSNFDFLGTWSF
jgi:hypothetical protein